MFFESHAHYDDEKFDVDRYELIEKLNKNGIDYIVNIGANIESSAKSIELAEKYPYIYAAVGVHPHEVDTMSDKDIQTLENYAENNKVVAIGEIGLDYYYDLSPRDKQRYWFKKQLKLSKKVKLPVIIHSREAAQECFDIIKESGVTKGVIHSFSGSYQMALDYIDMGFLIGVGGIVTFNNAKKIVEVVDSIPLNKLLIETDSPYLSPVPKRGSRNNSQNLIYITEKIAQIKQISIEKVAEITKENAMTFFPIK